MPAPRKPRLRPVETIVVPDPRHGKVLVLRDTQGIAQGHAVLPPPLIPIVARFTGQLTLAQIAREAGVELGGEVPLDLVEKIAEQLDEGLFLEGPSFERALEKVRAEFAAGPLRAASHAGGAYPGEKLELAEYIDRKCIAPAGEAKVGKAKERMVALVSPHIDPWRGAIGYGHAYGALAGAIAPEVDTFVVFGTSHAPMREPFALCRKGYDTPFGPMAVDGAFVDELVAAAEFDPYRDQLNHKREHSIEFQAVFLKHVLGGRPARIVPILAGLGDEQSTGRAPRRSPGVARFLDALQKSVQARNGRVVLVAGADMAHVGPRFGDPKPHNARERSALERTDRASLELAARGEGDGFWEHVAADLDTRRVCGLAPIFSLLDALGATKTSGRVLHYEQNIDPDDGSIVSHAALGFYRTC